MIINCWTINDVLNDQSFKEDLKIVILKELEYYDLSEVSLLQRLERFLDYKIGFDYLENILKELIDKKHITMTDKNFLTYYQAMSNWRSYEKEE